MMNQLGSKSVKDITKDILLVEYVQNKRSARDIAVEYNTFHSVIKRKLKKFGIETHDWVNKNYDSILTIDFLTQKFITEQLSIKEISELVGCSYSCVNNYLMKLQITANSRKRNKELLNKRFGMLVAIELLGEYRNHNSVYKCICDCGNTVEVLTGNLKSGGSKSCGCVRYQSGENSMSWKGHKELSGRYYCIVKANAASRNINFNISIEYLYNLFIAQDRKCALTGTELILSTKANQTASVDRINSDLGYIEGNVQWVHKDVNIMKMYFNQDYFIETCCKIAKNKRGYNKL